MYTVVALGIFLNVFLRKHKLYNLIKREIHILTTTIIKKTRKYIKFTIIFYKFSYFKIIADSFIINATNYIFFNVHNQVIIHPLNVNKLWNKI